MTPAITSGQTVIDPSKAKGWLRVQMEPIDVPIDSDDSILFSIVQSSIPGAHGLYYKENGVQKALKYDSSVGRVIMPDQGWDAFPIFVNIAASGLHMKKPVVDINAVHKKVLPKKLISSKSDFEKETLITSPAKKDGYEEVKHYNEVNQINSDKVEQLSIEVTEIKKKNEALEAELKECKNFMAEAKKMFAEFKNKQTIQRQPSFEVDDEKENLVKQIQALKFENDTLKSDLKLNQSKITKLENDVIRKDTAHANNQPKYLYTGETVPQKVEHLLERSPAQLSHLNQHKPRPQLQQYDPYPQEAYYTRPTYEQDELYLKRKQLDYAENKIQSLERELMSSRRQVQQTDSGYSEGFFIKKQPCSNRQKWNLLTTYVLTLESF
uniref:TDP43_N domain-containing protein n=1 Tax=Rhabditophanes sp. KR3021 TaxID=114890 RepID=A0AC35TUW5_9BILA